MIIFRVVSDFISEHGNEFTVGNIHRHMRNESVRKRLKFHGRTCSTSTIQKHLARFVQEGNLRQVRSGRVPLFRLEEGFRDEVNRLCDLLMAHVSFDRWSDDPGISGSAYESDDQGTFAETGPASEEEAEGTEERVEETRPLLSTGDSEVRRVP